MPVWQSALTLVGILMVILAIDMFAKTRQKKEVEAKKVEEKSTQIETQKRLEALKSKLSKYILVFDITDTKWKVQWGIENKFAGFGAKIGLSVLDHTIDHPEAEDETENAPANEQDPPPQDKKEEEEPALPENALVFKGNYWYDEQDKLTTIDFRLVDQKSKILAAGEFSYRATDVLVREIFLYLTESL